MKYTEFEKDICSLGDDYRVTQNDDYRVTQNDDYVYVFYEDNEILRVYTQNTFRLFPYDELRNCPKKQEVWNEAALLAATPLDEREEEKKYNVIIGIDDNKFECWLILWAKDGDGYTVNMQKGLYGSDCQFTESEYQNLLKYIKKLPHGDKQVKIAKIGKTLVKGE